MRMIHCSQKLLKELSGPVMNADDVVSDNTGAGNWYSDLFRFKRKNYIIFTNEQSFYTFFVYSINKHDIETISSLFKENLKLYLKEFIRNDAVSDLIIREYRETGFCCIADSSVVEVMDYFIRIFESRLEFIDEITDREMMIANMQVNTTPLGRLKYNYPLKKFKELIEKQYPVISG